MASSTEQLTARIISHRKPIEYGHKHVFLLYELQHEQEQPEQERSPIDLVVLLDRSGSMAETGKMDAAIATMQALIDQLGPQDRLSLVVFSHEVDTLAKRMMMTPSTQTLLASKVSSVVPKGGTALLDALIRGFTLANESDGKPAHVILLTDGHATTGETGSKQIIRLSAALREEATLSTFGYGEDTDIDLLTKLADDSHGRYYFVDSTEPPVEAFAAELGEQRGLVGLAPKLELEAGEGIVIEDLPAFLHVERDGDRRLTVDLPPLLKGGTTSLVLSLRPSKRAYSADNPTPWLQSKLTYRRAEDGEHRTIYRTFIPVLAREQGTYVPKVIIAMVIQRAAALLDQANEMVKKAFSEQVGRLDELSRAANVRDEPQVSAALELLNDYRRRWKMLRANRGAMMGAKDTSRGLYRRDVTRIPRDEESSLRSDRTRDNTKALYELYEEMKKKK